MKLWNEFLEIVYDIRDFFTDMWYAISGFFIKLMGRDAALIIGIMVIAIIAAIVLTKIIRK